MHTGVWRERDHSSDLCVHGRKILKKDHQGISWGGEALNGLICLRIGTSGGLLHAQ